jgi:hypothetical protein
MRCVWNRIETCKFLGFSNSSIETSGFVIDGVFRGYLSHYQLLKDSEAHILELLLCRYRERV